jgi:hypothetical protein
MEVSVTFHNLAAPGFCISILIMLLLWLPLWSSGHSSWQQIQRSGFDSRRYQIFWEVVGLELGPLSLVSTNEELLERNSSCSGLENRKYGLGDLLHWPHDSLYPQKLALTSTTSGVLSVGIVCSWTKATEFVFFPLSTCCPKPFLHTHSEQCPLLLTSLIHKVSFPLVPQLANVILREATARTW